MAAIKFDITGDNKNVLDSFNGVQQGVRKMQAQVENSGQSIEQMFGRIQTAATASLAGFSVKEFIQKVTSIRGEFQKLEVAFTTMLGSGERAQQLMQELTRTAAITPFDLKGVADGAKQLLAYGVAAENVNDTLIHLGDIAAGLSIPLGDLVMLYGTTMTQGRMFTQDLRQFMGRGIPLAEELAKQFGVTKDKVGELVTAGKVGAEEFNKAIMSMSSEGGKFAGLMEAQSKTIAGQISNIEDAIDTMFNEIGKSNEGIINDVLGSVSYLVENYKKVGAVLMDAVVAIGLYKTALITAHAIEKSSIAIKQAMAVQEALLTAEAKKLAAARGISIAAAKAELGSVNVLTVAKMRLTAATKALTASMLANPYTAVAVALAAVAFGVYKLATAEGVETAARRRANEEMQTFADKLDEQQNKIKGYIQTIQDETATEYQKAVAWEMLNKMAPTLTEKYDKATIATLDLAEATKELNEQADKANYDHIRSEVQKWKEAIERINQNMLDDARYSGGKNAIFNLQQLAGAEAQLDTYLKKLAEIDRIRKKMAEDAKPLEIRIKEANENVQAKQAVYDFYKRAADLAGELKNAHDVAAGTIANSNIPLNYEQIADDTREKYDSLIAELEADVEELRTKVAESPADIRLQIELEEKQKCLNDILDMKKQWAWSGVTTIPLNFVMNFSQVETSLQNAKNGQGINTEGMRFNGPTGTWVKDEATAPEAHTAAQWRKDTYNNWKQAQAAVDAFWNKKEEMDKATFDKEYKTLKDAADQAKKDYDKLKGDSSRSNAAKKAAETARQHQAYLDLIEKNKLERERAVQDMQFSTRQAEIDALSKGSEKTLAQLSLDFEKQRMEIERGYENLKQAKIEEARKLFEANPANKNSVFDASTVNTDYTEEEKANYEALLAANEASYRRSLEEVRKAQTQSMRDYLKEFGTVQQKRLAIQQEYDDKIVEETDETQKKILEAQKEKALDTFDIEVLKADIDWTTMFDGIGSALEEEMKETLDKIEKYMQSEKFKRSDAKEKAEWVKMRNELRRKTGGGVGTFDFSIYNKIGEDMETYQKARLELKEAEKAHTEALKEQEAATKELEKAEEQLRKARTEEEEVDAKVAVGEAKRKKQAADDKEITTGQAQQNAETNVVETQGALVNSTTQARQALDNFGNALSEIKSGSLKGFADGLVNLINAIAGNGRTNGLAGISKAGGIIGAILSIIDALGYDAASTLEEVIDKFFDTIINILDQIGTGELPEKVIGAVINGIQGLIESIARNWVVTTGFMGGIADHFGLLGGVGPGGASNHVEQQEIQQEISKRIETATYAINRLTEQLNESYGVDAMKKAEEAQNQLQKNQEDYIKGLNAALNDNYGGGHIDYWHWNKNTGDLAKQLAERYGLNFDGSWQSLFNNNPADEIAKMLDDLRVNNVDAWNTLITQGYNEGAVKKWLEELADTVKQSDEIDKALAEKLTTTTLDNVIDDFLDSLYDLANGSDDVFDNIAESWQNMVNKMAINNLVGAKFKERLNSWYENIAKLNEARTNGEITDAEYKTRLDALKAEYEGYVQSAKNDIETLRSEGVIQTTGEGSKYEQEATSGGWQSMSEDTAGELNGRFTALQMSGERISEDITSMVTTLADLSTLANDRNLTLTEIRNLMITNNAFLEDILEANKKAYVKFEQQLDKIVTQTK